VSDLWRGAQQRSEEFDARALDYDQYRPRYPDGLFDDIVELGALQPGATVIEIGAGTGIATGALADRGLQVTAIEPASAMAALGVTRLGSRARFVVGRFEDWSRSNRSNWCWPAMHGTGSSHKRVYSSLRTCSLGRISRPRLD